MFQIREKEQIPQIFEEQLQRTGVEVFDYYMLHGLGKPTYLLSEELGAFDFVVQKKREGKIKNIGLSYHDNAELLDEILTKHPQMEFVQLQINYIDWDDPIIEAEKCYEIATKHGKPVIVMEPLKGGSLVDIPAEAEKLFKAYHPDLSVASWALRFAAAKENVLVVLSGMSNQAQLEDNMGNMQDLKPLDPTEENIIKQAVEIINSSIAIACTGCRYCVDGCPENIAIPEYFAIYNNLKRFEKTQKLVAATYYENLAKRFGKASQCTECRQCEEHCPQHLPITEHLKTVAAALER